MQWIAKLIMRAPKLIIAAVLVITVGLGYFIPQLTIDNDGLKFIPETDEERVYHDQIRDVFGNDALIYIGLVTDATIYTPQTLQKVALLTTLLEDVEHVADVTSLATVNNIEGTVDGMDVSPLLDRDAPPTTDAEAQLIRDRVESWDVLRGNLVSTDGKATSLVIELEPNLPEATREQLFFDIKAIITAHQAPGESYHYSGYTTINTMLGRYMMDDIKRLLPIAFIVVAGTLYLSLKSLNGVLLPLLNVAIAVIWTMGLMAIFKAPLSLTCTAIPVVLVAVGVAYAIHTIHDFYAELADGQAKADALAACLQKVGLGVIMAGLTTVAGFGSLATFDVVPLRNFGIFSGIGTLFALVLALTFVPAVLYLERIRQPQKHQATSGATKPNSMDRLSKSALDHLAHWVLMHKGMTLACGVLILIISIYGTSQVYVDDNGIAYVRKGTTLRDDDTVMNQYFGGTHLYNVVITGPEPDSFKSPQLLQNMAALQDHVQQKFPLIGKTMSLADYIKKMNMAMHENDPAFYTLPDPADPESRDLIAQYLLLYSMSGDQDDFDSVVDYTYQQGCLRILAKEGSTIHTQRVVDEIYAYVKAHFAPEYKVRVTGGAYLMVVIDRHVIQGMKYSIISSLVIVWLLTIMSFRSLVGGTLSVIPLTLAVLGNMATMGLLRIQLDVGSSVVSNVAIGAGIDYALHFLTRVQYAMREQRLSRTRDGIFQACVIATTTVGQAIMYNAIAVAIGFLVLMASNFMPLIRLGGLVALTMMTTSLGSLIFLPVLLVLLKPKFIGGIPVEETVAQETIVGAAAL